MASGRNHDLSILLTSPVLGGVIYHYTDSPALALLAYGSHLLGGLFFSPDLDLVSRPYKRWLFLKFIWKPYQQLIPCHRHWLSHAPLIGSTLRLIYLGIVLSCLLAIFYPLTLYGLQLMGQTIEVDHEYLDLLKIDYLTWDNLVIIFLGVELSALNHIFLDGLLIPFPRFIKNLLK